MGVKPHKKRGRPPLPKGTARNTTFWVRLNVEEMRLVNGAIQRASLSNADWGRQALLEVARKGQ